MTIHDHNKRIFCAGVGCQNLGDLRKFIEKSDLPKNQKNQFCSAIKRADDLVGHGALDLPAAPHLILSKLDALSPAMAGMSNGSFANLKSRLRAAFRFATPRLQTKPRSSKLKGAWRALQSGLAVREQRNLSRLFHHAAGQGWQPDEIGDAHIDRFAAYLRDIAMVSDWESVCRNTIRSWNKLVDRGAPSTIQRLTAPTPKRTPYWIASEMWPATLRSHVDELLTELADPNIFLGRKARRIKPATVVQYGHMVTTLVSAMVHEGVELASLRTLHDALVSDNVSLALKFLSERGGGKITATMMQMMIRLRVLADMCDLPEANRDELEAIYRDLEANAPPERQRRHMAKKNRILLERLEHDQKFADLIQLLPEILAQEARAIAHKHNAPARMRTAVAVEILLIASIRRENLVTLKLGESIKRVGAFPNPYWIIEIDAENVKNDQPLRFKLEGETARLIDEYLADWRPRLCSKPNPWLFSNSDGGVMDPRSMALSIQRQSRRIIGCAISPHQFRHISAESFLLEHPDKLDLMSDHLGHRDRNTTRYYYARSKQKQASQAYQQHVLGARDGAKHRQSGRGRRRTADRGDDE